MFVDARELRDRSTVEADLCIVGGGAAAIPLAVELMDTPLRVVVLESGGRTSEGGREIYRVLAGPPPRLSTDPSRTWFWGGNTNYWNANCRPLDEPDFEPRAWIAHSGWPFRKRQMMPYYERAQTFCGLGDLRWYDLDACRPHLQHLPLDVDPTRLTNRILHTCPVPRFADLYSERFEAARNLRIYLHARAIRFRTKSGADQVCAVEAIGSSRNELRVEAGSFILAAGGIENARLLLCSNDVNGSGLANEHDLVGRFFMEHWHGDFPVGDWSEARDLVFHCGRQTVGDASLWSQLVLSDEFTRRERVPGLSLFFDRLELSPVSDGSTSRFVAALGQRVWHKEALTDLRLALLDPHTTARRLLGKLSPRHQRHENYVLRVQFEQTPNPDNRIRLSPGNDALGQPKAEMLLRLTDADRQAFVQSLEMVGEELSLDSRRLARRASLMLDAGRSAFFWHHMGTTRMHVDPTQGVVDADCRAHGVPNLFIAGSSVFPTGGTAPPTLTIVALALRLADHIRLLYGCDARNHTDPAGGQVTRDCM